jgi:hypothetical protein
MPFPPKTSGGMANQPDFFQNSRWIFVKMLSKLAGALAKMEAQTPETAAAFLKLLS